MSLLYVTVNHISVMMFPRLNLRASLTLHETRSVHDLMNRQKIEFITYIYFLYCLSSINFQLSNNLAGFLDILNYTRHNGGLGTAKTPNSRV